MGKTSTAGRANPPSDTAKGAHLYAEQSSRRQIVLGKLLRRATECVVLMIALAAPAQSVLTLSYLNCSTRKVVIISAPSGDTSSTREEEIMFVIDEAAKTLTFSDKRPLTVTRLGKYWISANREGIFLQVASPRWHPDVREFDNAGWRYDHHRGGRPVRDFASANTVKAVFRPHFTPRASTWTPEILCDAGGPRMR